MRPITAVCCLGKKYINTGRYVTCIGGVTAIFRLLPYRCVKCGKIIDGEFVGDYIGKEAVQRAQRCAENGPCFSCKYKEALLKVGDASSRKKSC